MDEENENYYKNFTMKLFVFALVLVVVKVFIDNGTISFLIPAMIEYEDMVAFVFTVLIYVFYIIGGLLTFNKKSHIYFYALSLNVSAFVVVYAIGTELFTKSFDYVEQLSYYSAFSTIFTFVTACCTLGIVNGQFTKIKRTK